MGDINMKTKKLIVLVALVAIAGVASAAVFSYYANVTGSHTVGRLWEIKTKHSGAGIYRVWLEKWRSE